MKHELLALLNPHRGRGAGVWLVALTCVAVFSLTGYAQNGTDPNDWPSYHRTLEGGRYSPLTQINKHNVSNLHVAWVHQPGAIVQGLQATPIAIDGVVYYAGSYNRVFALDGATGRELWHYYPELDPITEQIATAPYTRGVAHGHGRVYVSTADGRAIALDAKTGEELWQTTLVQTSKCGCLFTSPPLVVKDKLIYGSTAGGMPTRGGGIFGVDAATGQQLWHFEPVKEDTWGMTSFGESSAKYAGVGAWHVGSYDAETNTIIYGTSNPSPWFDWAPPNEGPNGYKRQDGEGSRPGDNLYSSSVVALDPDTGELKWYFQELPHDDWDFDSTLGEFVLMEDNGKKLVLHQAKSGFVYLYDRNTGAVENVWTINDHVSFVQTVDPDTGELIGRNPPITAEGNMFCPSMNGGRSWNSGSYNQKNGLWYNGRQEICQVAVPREELPQLEPIPNWYSGADFHFVHPPGDVAHGALDAWEPLTGKKIWSVRYKYPSLAGVLSTGGSVVFNGDIEGLVYAYDADTGQELWSFNTGSGIRGGIITYSVNGGQYVLVPSGIGSHVFYGLAKLFPETTGFPGGAALFAFKLGL